MITAEFIENSTANWEDAKRIVVNKKTIAGSPDLFVGVRFDANTRYLLELHAFNESVCFKSIRVVADNIVIGFGEYVHFFNATTESIKSIKLDTYFGHLYVASDLEYDGGDFGVLVTSAECLHRFTPSGKEIWKSTNIGVDGVTISGIEYPNIKASGEWDPPAGWIDVNINLENGANAI